MINKYELVRYYIDAFNNGYPILPIMHWNCGIGCDSGFGHDLARFLDSAGMRVFAGVLDELSPGALELKKAASPNVTVLQLDITNSSQITQALQYIQSQTGETGLWALVNNAGVLGYVCDGEILYIKEYKIPISTNSFEINHWFPSGEVPLPGFAGYGASKAALISFSGTIRQELSRWGVKVIIIQPGGFKTSENKSPFTPITIFISTMHYVNFANWYISFLSKAPFTLHVGPGKLLEHCRVAFCVNANTSRDWSRVGDLVTLPGSVPERALCEQKPELMPWRLRDRVAEHRYAIRTGNMNYPMAKHYIDAKHGSDSTLRVVGIEAVRLDARGGDIIKRLKQRETYWIYSLRATSHPGLNEDFDLSPFL
uniref:Hydroxysteroid (17-beta) dehydrogenase 2 n=1 Tax=Cyprinus carpio TaxID=7962 RepID=A0A8C2ET96_CYPCA